jgi:hypothetical protein
MNGYCFSFFIPSVDKVRVELHIKQGLYLADTNQNYIQSAPKFQFRREIPHSTEIRLKVAEMNTKPGVYDLFFIISFQALQVKNVK